jgi:hypothetical protein
MSLLNKRNSDGKPIYYDPITVCCFTPVTPQQVSLPEAIDYCRGYVSEEECKLISAQELATFYTDMEGRGDASRYSLTRTLALYAKKNGVWKVAFCDDRDGAPNILDERVEEAYEAATLRNEWIVPKTDLLVRAAVEDAYVHKRLLPVPTHYSDNLRTALDANWMQALFGNSLESYTHRLFYTGRPVFPELKSNVWLEMHVKTDDVILIQNVALGERGSGYCIETVPPATPSYGRGAYIDEFVF